VFSREITDFRIRNRKMEIFQRCRDINSVRDAVRPLDLRMFPDRKDQTIILNLGACVDSVSFSTDTIKLLFHGMYIEPTTLTRVTSETKKN
jgi:hypothetical protein